MLESKKQNSLKQSQNREEDRRKYLRINPEPLEYALISFDGVKEDIFKPQCVALIMEEAPMGGCSLVFSTKQISKPLTIRQEVIIKLGEFSPLLAEVVHITELDTHLVKVGFKFLE
jgi:hypothetical protein